ncbi:MAG TPA: sugar phosphate nucleotidyltransferase [Gaiellaceae bacterium]|nr:sugar phosphate nucleotidyltransferase [Gaiellaceae bacterium]
MKVVIFCGGRGMRLDSFSERLPKPMASIGGRPLLWHIMSYYAHFGHHRFLLLLGYRGDGIREYFAEPEFERIGWEIEFLDTGLDASIGERFAAARDAIDEDVFLASYGDTLTDADLPTLIRKREESGKLGSLLAVPPNYTFNVVASDGDDVVTGFHDVADSPLWINGGFFVFDRRVFDYVREGDDMPEILGRLIDDRELLAIKYDGFWSPMDTLKDRERLEALVRGGQGVWQVWAPADAR